MYMTLRFCDIIAWLLPNFPTNGASNQLKNFIIHWYMLEGRQKYSFFMYHFLFSSLFSPLLNLLPPHPECRQSQPSCKGSHCGSVSSGGLGLCHAPSQSDNPLKLDSGAVPLRNSQVWFDVWYGDRYCPYSLQSLEWPASGLKCLISTDLFILSALHFHTRERKRHFKLFLTQFFLLDLVTNLFSPDLVLITTGGHHRGACNPFTYHHFSSEISDLKALLLGKSAKATG